MVLTGVEKACKGALAPALALIGFALLQPSALSAGKTNLCSLLSMSVLVGLSHAYPGSHLQAWYITHPNFFCNAAELPVLHITIESGAYKRLFLDNGFSPRKLNNDVLTPAFLCMQVLC